MSGLMKLLAGDAGVLAGKTTEAIQSTNDVASQYGLSLTYEQASELQKVHAQALHGSGRIEIGDSMIDRVILAFCDSPHLTADNYADTIGQLVELFYYMKTDTLEQIPDDELLEKMKDFFDGKCGGSLELLANRELEQMARSIRAYGTDTPPEETVETAAKDAELTDFDTQEDDKWRTIRL